MQSTLDERLEQLEVLQAAHYQFRADDATYYALSIAIDILIEYPIDLDLEKLYKYAPLAKPFAE